MEEKLVSAIQRFPKDTDLLILKYFLSLEFF